MRVFSDDLLDTKVAHLSIWMQNAKSKWKVDKIKIETTININYDTNTFKASNSVNKSFSVLDGRKTHDKKKIVYRNFFCGISKFSPTTSHAEARKSLDKQFCVGVYEVRNRKPWEMITLKNTAVQVEFVWKN